jgi:hypothetical protein
MVRINNEQSTIAQRVVMTFSARGLEWVEYGPKRLLGGIAWIALNPWIALKDASWIGVIGLICIATLAASSLRQHQRHL